MTTTVRPPTAVLPQHTAGIFADMSIDGPEIGTLVIVMDRAKNLPNLRTMGKQDPYAAARLGKQAKKTDTDRRGGQTPKWDQELRFTVRDSLDYHKLKVSVFNDDKRTDLIGECWVQLDDLFKPGGGQSDGWHTLNCRGRYSGEIRIELTYYDSRPKPEKQSARDKKIAAILQHSALPGSSATGESASGTSRVPGPRTLQAVKRRPLPNPNAPATLELPAHSHSTSSLPDPPVRARETGSSGSVPVLSNARPASIAGHEEYSTLPEALPEQESYNHYSHSHQYSDAPEVYEDPEGEPFEGFTDDPYALQAVYPQEEHQQEDFRHEDHRQDYGQQTNLQRPHPSRLVPGHSRNAFSDTTGAPYEQPPPLESQYAEPIARHHTELTQNPIQVWDAEYQHQPPPPMHQSSIHVQSPREYDGAVPRRAPYPHTAPPPSHRLSYSNLPDEFGRDDLAHRLGQQQDFERRHSGDAVHHQQSQAAHQQPQYHRGGQHEWGVANNGAGFYPAARPDATQQLRQQSMPAQSQPLHSQAMRPQPFPSQGQHLHRQTGQPQQYQQPGNQQQPQQRHYPPTSMQNQPTAMRQSTLPNISSVTNLPTRTNNPAHRHSLQPIAHYHSQPPQLHLQQRMQPAIQQQKPVQSSSGNLTQHQQRSSQTSTGVPPPLQQQHQAGPVQASNGIPFGPDSFNSFNPHAAQATHAQAQEPPEPPRAFRKPSPMYNAEQMQQTSQQQESHEQSKDLTGRTKSGRVVLPSGRVIDPSDHIPSTAWAPEPERREKRPSVAVNVKNRFGPRVPLPGAAPLSTSNAGSAIKTGPSQIHQQQTIFQQQPKVVSGVAPPSFQGPLGPASENARYTTHGIRYASSRPSSAENASPSALQEEMRKIQLGQSVGGRLRKSRP